MLVRITANVMDGRKDLPRKVLINPDHISDVLESGEGLVLEMASGMRYEIVEPSWIQDAREESPAMQRIYHHLERIKEDQWADKMYERYGNVYEIPDSHY